MERAEQSGPRAIAASGWPRVCFFLIQFTWGLPVNLIGLLVFLCCWGHGRRERFHNSVVTYLPGNRGGLSLGVFLFLSTSGGGDLRPHEYGHTIQCLLLGPLYWVVVGLPSVIWCFLFVGYREKHHISYDALYCEHWATAWGRAWSGT